ncbi:MAG: hypothetical protein OIF54_01400 [Cohaesibacter sp.]|nr:hypothetical protein [Cohaesibacter sp.]
MRFLDETPGWKFDRIFLHQSASPAALAGLTLKDEAVDQNWT